MRARASASTRSPPGESLASIAGRYKVPETFIDRMNAGTRADLKPGDELWVPAGDVSQLRAGLGSDMERRTHRVKERRIALEHLAPLRHVGAAARAHEPPLDQGRAAARPAPAGRRQRRQCTGSRRAAAETQVASDGRQGQLQGPARRHALGIARRFEVTVRELQAWNNMGRSTALRAGQSLTIHVGGGSGVGG